MPSYSTFNRFKIRLSIAASQRCRIDYDEIAYHSMRTVLYYVDRLLSRTRVLCGISNPHASYACGILVAETEPIHMVIKQDKNITAPRKPAMEENKRALVNMLLRFG